MIKGKKILQVLLLVLAILVIPIGCSMQQASGGSTACQQQTAESGALFAAATAVTIEAESMSKSGYSNESNASASGGVVVKLSGTSGSVTKNFSGVTASYDISAIYIDQINGSATFTLTIGSAVIGTWTANQSTTADQFMTKTFTNISVANGAQIKLSGTKNGSDLAKWDVIKFVPAGTVSSSSSTTTSSSSSTTTSSSSSSSSSSTTTSSSSSSSSSTTTSSSSSSSSLMPSDIIAAPNAPDTGAGTLASPMSFTAAITKLAAGNTIYVRGGTYSYSVQITIERGNNGSSNAMKKIIAYNGEKPIFDFSSQPYNGNGASDRGIKLDGNYWYIKGLEIKGAADNGMYISGNNNTIELCVFDYNRDAGLQLGRFSEAQTTIDSWPSYNLILNCDSFMNDDPDNHEDADGFGCKLTTGYGNVFRGCIAHHNNDDGWDLFMKAETGPIGPVTIEGCIAWANGIRLDGSSFPGDGNGFKLGGNSIDCPHTVVRCIAIGNRVKGFHANVNGASMTVTNNTAYGNLGGAGFNFSDSAGTAIFKNNLSFNNSNSDYTYGTDVESTNCWWKGSKSVNAKGLIVDASDFVSVTPTFSRNADGSINIGNCLKLASGSDLVNAGTPSGTDIGAVESN